MGAGADKENAGVNNSQTKSGDAITIDDRNMLKTDIFGALDNVVHLTDAGSKVIEVEVDWS